MPESYAFFCSVSYLIYIACIFCICLVAQQTGSAVRWTLEIRHTSVPVFIVIK